MKVLYFTRGYSPHDERFLTALAKTGNEIYYLRLERNPTVALPQGVQEIQFSNSHPPRFYSLLGRAVEFKHIIARLKPDIVHAGPVHGPALIAALAGITPLVTMSWAADLLYAAENSLFTKIASAYALRHSTILAGDCRAVADKAVEYGFSRERIFLFPWGVVLDHFHPVGSSSIREKLGWQDNFVFLCNRSMEPIYGVDVLIQGFIEAEKHNPNIRLLLYGKGSQETRIRQMIAEAGIGEKVHFGGFASRAELPDIYRSADIYVTASHCDGSSVSLMEALACGRPALVSDIPGNLEWVQEGVHGWVFQDGHNRELTEKMIAVSRINNLEEIGKGCRSLAEQKANWVQNFPVLIEAYHRALELDQKNTGSGRHV